MTPAVSIYEDQAGTGTIYQLRLVAQRRPLSPKTIGVYSQLVKQFLTFGSAESGN